MKKDATQRPNCWACHKPHPCKCDDDRSRRVVEDLNREHEDEPEEANGEPVYLDIATEWR